MSYNFAPKLAGVITGYSTNVQPGDFVVIIGNTEAVPLVEALYVKVLERGGNPVVQLIPSSVSELLYEYGEGEQLDFLDPIMKLVVEEADVILQIESPVNTKALANADPKKMQRSQRTRTKLLQTLIRRIGEKSLRWCLMPWPTAATAQQTDMGTHAYREFLYRACALDKADPVGHWEAVRDQQLRLVEYLNQGKFMVVRGPGIDLSFSIEGRQWVSAHGNLNFPDGEFFTGPVEDSVNGAVTFNMPSLTYGREVNGVSLTFRDGRVIEVSAQKGEAFLLSQLDLDEGARRVGEFAIGNNWGIDRVTGSTLLDEKIGGTIHIAMGASLPDTGGVNESKLHWDMVHDMKQGGEIEVDGKLFYREGEFLLD